MLALEGRIVTGEIATLRNAVQSQPEVSSLVLDLARVSAIDARGLGLMLELRDETQSRGIRFKVINATRLVRRVFEITRLDSVFEFAPVVEFVPPISRTRSTGVIQYVAA